MRMLNVFSSLILSIILIAGFCLPGCSGALTPEQTPERTVIYFLRDVGRSDFEAASQWVAADSADMMEAWRLDLFFPEHQDPPTSDDVDKIERFIGNFYTTNIMDQGETEATVSLTFAATDAIIGFPSVADSIRTNSALYTIRLVRTMDGEGESASFGDWKISEFSPS